MYTTHKELKNPDRLFTGDQRDHGCEKDQAIKKRGSSNPDIGWRERFRLMSG